MCENNKIKKFLKKLSSGRSMVEMIGVMAVVGCLSIGGLAGYVKASHILRTNKLKDDISHLIANIRTVFYAQNDYKAISVVAAINAGVVPEYMIGADKVSMINRLNGSIYIGPAATELDENGAFILVFNGLDGETCRSIVSEDWGSDMQTGFLGMTVKKDGELTVETSKMLNKEFQTDETTFNARDLRKSMTALAYTPCDCGTMNLCAIAWKFL